MVIEVGLAVHVPGITYSSEGLQTSQHSYYYTIASVKDFFSCIHDFFPLMYKSNVAPEALA